MNKEKNIKEYLRNKSTYKRYVEDNIIRLKDDINSQSTEFKLDIGDFAFPEHHNISIERSNRISDRTAETVMRYEEYKERIISSHIELMNERLEQLLYLTELKKLYDRIDFLVIKLSPKQKISIDIYTKGGKISQIAQELKCSYNTARTILNGSIKMIVDGVNES